MNVVTIFNREHYLSLIDKQSYDDTDVLRDNKIKGLTERGFRNFDLIRNDEILNLIKSKFDNFDDVSIYTLRLIGYLIYLKIWL